MHVVRIVSESLSLLVFRVARFAFLMQGLAMCAAFLATTLIRSEDAPPWLDLALRSSLNVSATLFVAGILLALAARRVTQVEAEQREDGTSGGLREARSVIEQRDGRIPNVGRSWFEMAAGMLVSISTMRKTRGTGRSR